MQKTKFTVYWTSGDGLPHSSSTLDMDSALQHMKLLRQYATEHNYSAIVMASENADRVGEDGVDEVKDGKTPDGVDYTWNKSSRIGATR